MALAHSARRLCCRNGVIVCYDCDGRRSTAPTANKCPPAGGW